MKDESLINSYLACGFERIVCQEFQQKIFLKHIFREKWFFFGLIRLFICSQASSANIGLPALSALLSKGLP